MDVKKEADKLKKELPYRDAAVVMLCILGMYGTLGSLEMETIGLMQAAGRVAGFAGCAYFFAIFGFERIFQWCAVWKKKKAAKAKHKEKAA